MKCQYVAIHIENRVNCLGTPRYRNNLGQSAAYIKLIKVMYKLFKISDLLVYNKSLKDYFNKFRYLVYRIYNPNIGMSYIGVTRSMINRLYNKKFGHVTNILNNSNSNDLYTYINELGSDNFYLSIEKECSDLLDLSQSEIKFIEKYDSFRNGFNKTKGGFIRLVLVSNGVSTITSSINDIPKGFKVIGLPKYDRVDLKGRILVNNGMNLKRIRESQLDEYLMIGYEIGSGGLMDHMSGKIFIHLTDESDRLLINSDEFPIYESLGYKKGRVTGSSLKGGIRVTNGMTNLVVHSLDDIPKGYHKGVAPSPNRKGNSGRKWINNGIEDKAVLLDELQTYLISNWRLGRLSSSKRDKISMIIDDKVVFIHKSLKAEYELKGYIKGSSKNSGKNKGKFYITDGKTNKMIFESEFNKYSSLGFYKGITRKPRARKP